MQLMMDERQPETSEGGRRSGSRWGQERRLEFIEYRLRWNGHLNRADLTSYFGISVPQASLDLAEYSRRAPNNLEYDHSTRMYLATAGLKPLFPGTNERRYLDDLVRAESGIQPREESFLGWHPDVAVTPKPTRHVSDTTVSQIVHAIRECHALTVRYQSLAQPEAFSRIITPHALAQDGSRWHVRAFCHTRQAFRDFVISRIIAIEGTNPDHDRSADDVQWRTNVRLAISPDPRLSPAQRQAIELDYDMVNGIVQLACRQALLLYVLRQLRLYEAPHESAMVQQIVLQNRAELDPVWPKSEYR